MRRIRCLLLIIAIVLLSNTVFVNASELRDVYSDTYVGTDDLGRTLPTWEDVGDAREGKYVGIFYFLFLNPDNARILDHSKVFAENGVEALWDILVQDGMHFWGEPYFGYYKNTDEWIYRKHARILSSAGVDFVFLDITNLGGLFDHAWNLMFKVWDEIRKEGGQTPQIIFHCGDTDSTMNNHMKSIWKDIYRDGNYRDLWFMWEGKPLILGNPSLLEQKYKDFFTIRSSWAFNKWTGDGIERWPWIAEYPQSPGRNLEGLVEQVVVSSGFHSNSSRGRSFSNNKQPDTNKMDFGFSLETTDIGLAFDETWKGAFEIDPDIVMITGWNEFTMGRWENAGIGQRISGSYYITENDRQFMSNYVDCFNTEYSRDIEPIRGFHQDNYLYQMAAKVREYKGVRKIEKGSNSKDISDLNDLSVWEDVSPKFYDYLNDINHRDHMSVGGVYHYINESGRNDIDYIKVQKTADYTYFMINCANDIIIDYEGMNWMNIFIDRDMNFNTGWKGYDYILNLSRDTNKLSVSKFVNGNWDFESVGQADYIVSGKTMVVKVKSSLIGLKKHDSFDFKVADNSTVSGEVMEFMDLGDSAPDDRYNFRFIKEGGKAYRRSISLDDNFIAFIIVIIVMVVLIVASKYLGKRNVILVLSLGIFLAAILLSFTHVNLYVKKDISSKGDYVLQAEVLDEFVRAFEKKNPKYRVNIKYVREFPDDISSADIILINAESASYYMKKDCTLLDLNIESEGLLEPALALGQYKGDQVFMPFNYDRTVVYLNKEIFDMNQMELPKENWTIDEFEAIAKSLTYQSKADLYVGVHIPYNKSSVWKIYVKGFGGQYYDYDAKEINLTSGNSLVGIDRLFSLLQAGQAKAYGYTMKRSNVATSAMAITYALDPANIGQYCLSEQERSQSPATYANELLASDNLVLMPMPVFPEFDGSTSNSNNIMGFSVNKNSSFAKRKAGKALIEFALEEKGQKILYKYYAGIPVNKEMWDKDFWKKGYLGGHNANRALINIEKDIREDFFEMFEENDDPYYYNLRTRVFFTTYIFRDFRKIEKGGANEKKYISYLENFEKDINKMILMFDIR